MTNDIIPQTQSGLTEAKIHNALDALNQQLQRAETPHEAKMIADSAEILADIASKAGMTLIEINAANEVRLDSLRRGGELLEKLEKVPGQRTDLTSGTGSRGSTYKQALDEIGILYRTAQSWRQLAFIPQELYGLYKLQKKEDGEEITLKGALQVAKKILRELKREEIQELTIAEQVSGKFSVIYADPPWQYSNSNLGGAAEDHYPTMATDEICGMPVKDIATKNAVLFMWVTNPLLPDGLRVIEAWGFEYKTNFVWVKDRSTYGKLGFYNYSQHELLLIATRGQYTPAGELPTSIIDHKKGKHSKKPEEVYALIEEMYPTSNYLEMFARNTHDGWQSYGNEVL